MMERTPATGSLGATTSTPKCAFVCWIDEPQCHGMQGFLRYLGKNALDGDYDMSGDEFQDIFHGERKISNHRVTPEIARI
jgi:hypothetical protein